MTKRFIKKVKNALNEINGLKQYRWINGIRVYDEVLSGGGGGTPSHYLISATIDATTNTLNITPNIGDVIHYSVDLSNYYTKNEVDTKLQNYCTAQTAQQLNSRLVNVENITTNHTEDIASLNDRYDTIHEDVEHLKVEKADTSDLEAHINNKSNPHNVTANQLGVYTSVEVEAKLNEKQDKDFIVTIRYDDSAQKWVADKPFDDILSAYNSGKTLIAYDSKEECYLYLFNIIEQGVMFNGGIENTHISALIVNDNFIVYRKVYSQFKLPNATASGLYLKSTDTTGGVEWASAPATVSAPAIGQWVFGIWATNDAVKQAFGGVGEYEQYYGTPYGIGDKVTGNAKETVNEQLPNFKGTFNGMFNGSYLGFPWGENNGVIRFDFTTNRDRKVSCVNETNSYPMYIDLSQGQTNSSGAVQSTSVCVDGGNVQSKGFKGYWWLRIE